MLGARNYLFLQILSQIAEIIAIPRHANDQIPVFFRMRLCAAQRGPIDHVELNVVATKREVCPDKMCDRFNAYIIMKEVRSKLLVK